MRVDAGGQHVLERTAVLINDQVRLRACLQEKDPVHRFEVYVLDCKKRSLRAKSSMSHVQGRCGSKIHCSFTC